MASMAIVMEMLAINRRFSISGGNVELRFSAHGRTMPIFRCSLPQS